VWLIGAVVSLLAANRGSICLLTQTMDGRIVQCGIIKARQTWPCSIRSISEVLISCTLAVEPIGE